MTDILGETGIDAISGSPAQNAGCRSTILASGRDAGAYRNQENDAPVALPIRASKEKRSLGSFIAGFKYTCTIAIKKPLRAKTIRVWQRNYYERIIRREKGLDAIREYIHANPARWQDDPENPGRNIPTGG